MEKVEEITKVYPGDYLYYFDEYEEQQGAGALVKKVTHEIYPLTKSFYVLKNINSGRCWKVNTRRYTFFVKRHNTSSFDLNDLEEIKEIRKKYL